MLKAPKGFTLIELIIVVAIIGLLAAAIFVAVDPAKRISNATDARRWNDINSIMDAILKYSVDTGGTLPSNIGNVSNGTQYMIAVAGNSVSSNKYCTSTHSNLAQRDISTGIVGAYIATMPVDGLELNPVEDGTGYYFSRNSNGRITIGACYESNYAVSSIYIQR